MDIEFRKITDFPRGTLATISFTTILTLPTSADL